MTTATLTKHLLTVAKAPDSRGTFEGEIEHNPEHGDKDGERIASFTNVPGTFPLLYQHTYGDPGSEIGTVHVLPKGDDRHLIVLGRLDLSKPMAEAIYARMLLPSDDSMALNQMSVGFNIPTKSKWKDRNGIVVIEDAELLEVSVVYRGAQSTSISNVKTDGEADVKEDAKARAMRQHLDSSHAQIRARLNLYSFPDLIRMHRLAHAELGPTTEKHLRTGQLEGGTAPATTTNRRSYHHVAEAVSHVKRVEGYVAEAKANAERDRLLDLARQVNEAKLAGDRYAGMSFSEIQEADRKREAWEAEKAQAEFQGREADRAEAAARADAAAQSAADWVEFQRQRDAEAVASLLSQDGPSFTMQIGPDGVLRDPDDHRSDAT
jgi:HK97 family phage prohead protease